MRLLMLILLTVFYGFLLHGWWKQGQIPTFLWFEANREKNPATYRLFFMLSVILWIVMLGMLLRAVAFPETSKYLYRTDPLRPGQWVVLSILALGVCAFTCMALVNVYRKKLVARITNDAGTFASPQEQLNSEAAFDIYTLRELRLLQSELIKMPKGFRSLTRAMKRVEQDWPE